MHQVLVAHDLTDSHTSQYPFISIGSTSGIGTFSSTLVGSDLCLNFHPDPSYTGGTNNVQVQTFTEAFYTTNDALNVPPDLQYGTVTESLSVTQYDAKNGLRSNKTSFPLQSDSIPIFQKQFNPSDSSVLDIATDTFTINDHFFETGERLIYSPGSTFTGISLAGITTSGGVLPSELYAIRINKDKLQIAKTHPDALARRPLTITGAGVGNAHEFEMFKKNEKALMTIDGVIQTPMAFTPITTELEFNITNSETIFSLTGISSITSDDVIKVNDEFMQITNVGLGTTNVGPITETGSVKLVEVKRGAIGSASTNHSLGDTARLFSGVYNIVDSTVHFVEPPRGTNNTVKTQANLDPDRSTFNGRVYLRQSYATNTIFDDISDSFTGIGKTFDLAVGGANTTGIQTGSSILLLNGIFQTPTTFNNLGNNYEFLENGGISQVSFTGISSSNGTIIISDTDVNQNQLPRGGVIVSLGSTGGLGVANLSPAKVKATTNGSGSIVGVVGIPTTGDSFTVSDASYNNTTGQLQITTSGNHGFRNINEFVRLSGLTFNPPTLSISTTTSFSVTGILSATTFTTNIGISTNTHSYVSGGTATEFLSDLSFGSGYRNPVSVAVTDLSGNGSSADVSAIVGDGGSLSFVINNNGTGYTKPQIQVSAPSYQNLPVTGVSRRGIGSTTDTGTGATLTIGVGAANTSVGIGSTLFTVTDFTLDTNGYNFKVGDVFKPVGLVTAKGLSSMVNDFELTVTEVFRDQYASWNFGDFDFVDPIKELQNGVRKRFPLVYNSSLLSFEIDEDNPDSSLIDLNSLLLIFVNGVIQNPGESYTFNGGTSFDFTVAPDDDDIVDIFFYKGTNGVDSVQVAAGSSVSPTIKKGDIVQVFKDNSGITTTQEQRTIYAIRSSDEVETDLYKGLGIDERNFKPLSWTKQKVDKKINGEIVSKSRDSIESQVYPTSKIIDDLSTTDNELFVDNARFFNYEEDFSSLVITNVGGLIVGATEPTVASITASVSIGGTVALTIVNGGSGYVGSTTSISISSPHSIGVGIGTTAIATATITNGVITGTTITNAGFGYTSTAVPQVIVQLPRAIKEDIDGITTVEGYDGIISGIGVTDGVGGHPLALKFTLEPDFTNNPNSTASQLKVGYPIVIFGTKVGHGVTSVVSDNNTVVATGTTCLDNIYFINEYNSGVGIITCNIHTGVNTTGINGATVGFGTGGFSWGRLSGFSRGSNPISIGVTGLTIDSGLSTYPTIQRRDFGLRNTGSLRKDLG